ncbi:MAG TPA: transcription termination factor NusA [Thermogutta sp.]|mgnify:CR=1 FL=1|nr:transcription termination factor NusA [Thermogutta sp.]HPU05198.1 transcription termination factor NusA [Thermogutta sp.]
MNPDELLRIVDAIHREKNIEKEVVFKSIEAALATVARKRYGDQADISISIDRKSGVISGRYGDQAIDPEQLSRIGAQAAKQVILQRIREAERDVLYEEYQELLDQVVTGTVQKVEPRAIIVSLPRTEAILPKSEQIPGETRHPNERIRAVVTEVKKAGTRLRIVLSRIRPVFVVRLFEQEVPEIADGVIEIKSIAREPGYRTKVAVASVDQRVDCVGACVGLRGNRIRNIVEELSGERIDIIRWDDDLMTLIPNALQPAKVDEVILCQMLGRAIVLVPEDQLSLAIGRWGQNVRLASKLCGWDIEIMTRDELDEQLEQAVLGFSSLEGVTPELADRLVGEGFLSYDDLSVIEPEDLMEMGGLTEEQVQHIIAQAEAKAEEAEQLAREEKRRQRQLEREREAALAEGVTSEVPPSAESGEAVQDQEEAGPKEDFTQEASSGLGEGTSS